MLENQEELLHSRDKDLNTALHMAAKCRYFCERLRSVKSLVEFGADVNAANRRGQTPLHMACIGTGMARRSDSQTREVVAYLIKAGAAIFAISRNWRTPFHEAVINGEAQSAMVLLRAAKRQDERSGLGEFDPDPSGTPLLHTAVRNGHAEMVEFLVEQGANVKLPTNGRGDMLVHLAVESSINDHYRIPGYIRMMGCILLGRDVSVEVAGGDSLLEYLKNKTYLRIIKYFCQLEGYDHWKKNLDLSTPFGLAKVRGFTCLQRRDLFDDFVDQNFFG